MYDTDMPVIRAHGLASPEGLVDVITFCLLTIRQPLQQVARQFADVRSRGAASPYLFSAKRAGWLYANEHKDVLFAAVSKAVEVGDVVGCVDVLTVVPSLGMVKAAFVAQCLGLNVGCMDMHNIARLGMKPDAFKLPKSLKSSTRLAKITAYVSLTQKLGARAWWDSWCAYVAGRRSSPLKTPQEVSRFHVTALCLA